MTKQRRFTKEFEDEAVRLVATSGRTQREIAEDLGVGLSTLVRWISRSRDRLVDTPDQAPQADMAAELKRLRRENEILRQERDILKRATAFFALGGKSMRFQLIDPGERISRSTASAGARRQRDDMVMLAHVRSAFALSNGTYGSPRMTRELQDDGFAIGRRRTARLMRENDLRARQKRRFKRTTDSEHAWPIAPNIIDQDFTATATNQKWGVDISYVWTREGWLYLAVVIDLFSRRVVGWAVGDRLHRDLALAALRKALVMRRPPRGSFIGSDRGSQYCSVDYQAELRRHGIRISMSGKGNCYDNAMVETFFKTIKSELVWPTVFYTRTQAEQAIARYIDGFYNPVRRHSALNYTSPAQFEQTRHAEQMPLHLSGASPNG
jgi:putative transposase